MRNHLFVCFSAVLLLSSGCKQTTTDELSEQNNSIAEIETGTLQDALSPLLVLRDGVREGSPTT